MKPTAFDNAVATEVENAVMAVYGCERHDIIQFKDSDVKKVVVFILYHHMGYNKRFIGLNYRITHWYVPTASDEVKVLYERDGVVREKIDRVLSKISSYAQKKNLAA